MVAGQLKALLRKNYLLKRSQWCQTSCEILSPLLICWLLATAYGLFDSLKQVIPAQVYVNQTLTSPEVETFILAASEMEYSTQRATGTENPSIDGLIDGETQCIPMGKTQVDLCVFAPLAARKKLEQLNDAIDELNEDSGTAVGEDREGPKDFKQDDGYNGFIPVPPLDVFIALHKIYYGERHSRERRSDMMNQTGSEISQGEDRAVSYVTSGQYDNIIRLGALVFAPDTPATRGLVDHLNRTSAFFHEYFGGIYADEGAAVDAALKPLPYPKTLPSGEVVERAWAAIIVHEMDVEVGKADYTIRMNFSATPFTQYYYMDLTPQLNIQYRKYYTSGFLSLQQAIAGYYLNTSKPLPPPPPPKDDEQPEGPPDWLPDKPGDILDPDWWRNLTANGTRRNPENKTQADWIAHAWGEQTFAAPFPTPEVELNLFYQIVGPMASILLSLCMLFTLSRLVKSIVDEKEKQLRLLMDMMGLTPLLFGISWLTTYAVVYGTIAVFLTWALKTSFMFHVQWFLLLMFITLYCFSQLTFGLFIASMFNRAKMASIVGPLLLFSFLLPRYAFYYVSQNDKVTAKLWCSLFSPTAFSFGIDIIFNYGAAQAPLDWSHTWDDELPFGAILLMLFTDALLYFGLAVAIDYVNTSQAFPSLDELSRKSYDALVQFWSDYYLPGNRRRGSSNGNEFELLSAQNEDEDEKDLDDVKNDALVEDSKTRREKAARTDSLVEPVAEGMEGYIELQELRKVYERGCGAALQRTVAVDGLSMMFYRGQITCLLGHNGAGKTTTISMLTGMLPPTSGTATVGGRSIATEQTIIRQSMGVCPQHDILWDNLTVEAHLKLFAVLKGVPQADVDRVCRLAAEEVSLAGRGYQTKAKALSGGMKRKLCVALSFMGNAGVVYLDEPTSGMDPYSRRWVWNLLRSKKDGRVIVLTTHFMDEAELLADRIAIMATGRLNCCGSALYLKSRSGIGYTLTMTTTSARTSIVDEKMSSLPDIERVVSTVKASIPSASVLNVAGGEVSMRLPLKAVSNFPSLFEKLDAKKSTLGIQGYGISITTLEEVFIQVCRGGKLGERSQFDLSSYSSKKRTSFAGSSTELKRMRDGKVVEDLSKGHPKEDEKESVEEEIGQVRASGILQEESSSDPVLGSEQKLSEPSQSSFVEKMKEYTREFGRNFTMLTWKRAVCAMRDIKGIIFEFIVPLITICLVLLILKLNVNPAGPSITLSAELYGQHCADTTKGEPVDPPEGILTPYSEGVWQQLGRATAGSLAFESVYTIINSTDRDSLNVSERLLEEVHEHSRTSSRINAFVANDSLTLTVSKSIGDAIEVLKGKLQSAWRQRPPIQGGGRGGRLAPPGGLPGRPGRPVRSKLQDDSAETKVAWKGKVAATILHNSTYFHALPVGLAEMQQARLRAIKGAEAYVRVRNHPLPLTKIASMYIDTLLTLFAAIFLLLPFCYLPGTLSMFWVREKELHVKHVHFVSGVSPLQYWISAFAWDLLSIALIDAAFIFILMAYGNDEFIGTPGRAWATYVLVFVYGLSVIPLSYLLSYAFSSASSAQVGIAAFHFVSGFVLLIISAILQAIPSTYSASIFLRSYVFRLLPPFVLGEGLIKLSLVALLQEILGTSISPWSWHVLGRPVTYLMVTSHVYFLAVLALDSKTELRNLYRQLYAKITGQRVVNADDAVQGFTQITQREVVEADDQDEDVKNEAEQVSSYLQEDRLPSAEGSAAIAVSRLVKSYPPLAVNNLSLLVPKCQCFGLLGVNGAGKSTTLKILTADVEPTSGRALVNGISVREGVRAIRQQLGYCPQFNSLLPAMTVNETIWLYARLRGLPDDEARRRTAELIDQLRLGPHEHKRCGALSGGNKRKVTLAIALVGDPPVLFLDEPSTGMDPVTRRYMWDMIAELGRKRCVVLTTHSMEECEALCTRIGIMSKGKLRCIGTLQRLKNRHGKGYHLEVSTSEAKVPKVQETLGKLFPGITVLESYGGKMKLRLGDSKVSLAKIFRSLERSKKALGITDYSVTQSSLEQIFISMVRETFEEGGNPRGGGGAEVPVAMPVSS